MLQKGLLEKYFIFLNLTKQYFCLKLPINKWKQSLKIINNSIKKRTEKNEQLKTNKPKKVSLRLFHTCTEVLKYNTLFSGINTREFLENVP